MGTFSIPNLHAGSPDPKHKDKLLLFGQFVGSWKIRAKYHAADGSKSEGIGEVHFGWILGGKAVQDVFLSYQGTEKVTVGTTVRYIDNAEDAIRCIWIAPLYSVRQTFLARQIGEEIVLEAQNQPKPEKWIFSKITPQPLYWRAIEISEGRADWRLPEEMWWERMAA